MMDPAYFTGKKLIIQWMNDTFKMNVEKIEDTASGAVACQVLDAIYPGEMAMSKVRWDARSPHEFIDNYKLFQRLLDKKGVDKHVEVERLMRGKYQDNLENMQWLKQFYEKNYAGQPYDPLGRRVKGRGADTMPAFAVDPAAVAATVGTGRSAGGGEGGVPAAAAAAPSSSRSANAAIAAAAAAATGSLHKRAAASTAAAAAPGGAAKGAPSSTSSTSKQTGGAGVGGPTSSPVAGRAHITGASASSAAVGSGGSSAVTAAATAAALQRRVGEVTAENVDLRLTVESLEKERDFYFGKLRDIEILLQSYTGQDRATADTIFKILYATEDDFQAPGQQQQDNNNNNTTAAPRASAPVSDSTSSSSSSLRATQQRLLQQQQEEDEEQEAASHGKGAAAHTHAPVTPGLSRAAAATPPGSASSRGGGGAAAAAAAQDSPGGAEDAYQSDGFE